MLASPHTQAWRRTVVALSGAGAIWLATVDAAASTWYITPDGTGDAPTIAAGVDSAAAGDTVLVACGVFLEHGIRMKSGVTLRGETGDPGCATIDSGSGGIAILCEFVDDAARIEGLTIRGGAAGGPPPYHSGGAIFCRGAALTIADCLFEENSAPAWGGAVYLLDESNAVLAGCEFRSNSASFGGAVACENSASPLITGSRFDRNIAHYGGALYCAAGGRPEARESVFTDNSGVYGGAVAGVADGAARLIGCEFSRNRVDLEGAVLWGVEEMAYQVAGCTLVESNGGPTGAIYARDAVSLVCESSIVAFTDPGAAVFCEGEGVKIDFACCDVYGNAGGDWTGCLAGLGVGDNFSADPRFCDAPEGDYTLDANSPCLPGRHPGGYDCGTIGAYGASCGTTASEPVTWGALKARMWR